MLGFQRNALRILHASLFDSLLTYHSTGVISSTLLTIHTDLSNRPLSTFDKSIITSITSLLALFASPLAGMLADAWGRRLVVFTAAILFVLGALVQAAAVTVWIMVLGRALVGGGVGMGSFVVPLYISELSPAPFRGRLVTVSSLFITGGQVVAYVVGWLFSETDHGWRWMVGLGAIPALGQLLALAFLPETPRWLVKAGRREEARKVLDKVFAVDGSVTEATRQKEKLVKQVLDDVVREVEEEEQLNPRRPSPTRSNKSTIRSWLEGLSDGLAELTDVGANKRALTIACMLQGLQQLCGFVSIHSFLILHVMSISIPIWMAIPTSIDARS
jgi:MFS transporter, SP family, solute carrier family 2 (myo-inositol transporter), member 13